MARKGSKSSGSLALTLALSCAGAGLVGGLLVAVAVVQNLAGSIADPDAVSKGWQVGLGLAVLCAAVCGGAAWVVGGKLATRITDIQLAVSKLGRGGIGLQAFRVCRARAKRGEAVLGSHISPPEAPARRRAPRR